MKTLRKKNLSSALRKNPALSEPLEKEFLHFLEYHQARRFSRNLRTMLFEFLRHDNAFEAIYLKDLLYDLEGLFELLDQIENETKEDLDE